MRSFEEIKILILDKASSDERIRAVLLNGSRANDKIVPDKYQDYDVVFIVNALETFICNHEWTNILGEKILWQLPREMKLENDGNKDSFTYRIVFTDGNRYDVSILRYLPYT